MKNKFSLIGCLLIILSSNLLANESASSNDSDELLTIADKLLELIQDSNKADYHRLIPILEQKLATQEEDNKAQQLLDLSLYYLMSDDFSQAKKYLTILKHDYQAFHKGIYGDIATIYLVAVKYRFNRTKTLEQLNIIKKNLKNPSNIKVKVNLVIAESFGVQAFANYQTLHAISSVLIQLQSAELLQTEKYMLLWRQANLELDYTRRLSALNSLMQMLKTELRPLNRFILFYNTINYFSSHLYRFDLADKYADAYISLSISENRNDELFFAYERKATVLRKMGKYEQAISFYQKSRSIGSLQSPHWLAILDSMEAKLQILVGNIARAKLLYQSATQYFDENKKSRNESLIRTSAYINFLQEKNVEGFFIIERYLDEQNRKIEKEKDSTIKLMRDLADKSHRSHLKAESNLHAFQLSSIALFIAVMIISLLLFKQHKISKKLISKKEQLEKLSKLDGLTGVSNRSFIEERILKEFSGLERRQLQKAAIVMLDIDYFKAVNDQYGHLCGDEVLRGVTSKITSCLRQCDFIGRYGGEEFVILLPGTNLDGAGLLAERVREEVQKTSIEFQQQKVQVTVSIGVCEYSSEFSNYKQWIAQADRALYCAKNKGRNRVVSIGHQQT